MNLSDIDIKLAEYTNPQAVNLGFVTARRYFPKLFLATLLAYAPLLLIAGLLVYFFQAEAWASLLLWWCKPYIDRVILLNASRLLFREPIGFTDLVKSLGTACKNGLFLNLTFFRFSPSRCLTLPIMVLEQLSGSEYSKRRKTISRGNTPASAVTVALFNVDFVLYLNAIILIFMLVPDSFFIPDNDDALSQFFYLQVFESLDWLFWVLLPIQALCSAIVEVFYVMIGFMLYLNSRIKIEGWHIELAFKQIAERLAGIGRVALSWLGVVGLAVILSQSPLQNAFADDINTVNTTSEANLNITPDKDKQILKDLLSDENTNPYHQKTKWVKNTPSKKLEKKKLNPNLNFNTPDLSGVAGGMKALLIVLLLALIVWIIIKREKFAGLFQNRTKVTDDLSPTVLFGLDVRKETLPDDIAGRARLHLENGDILAALSLLYRGSLSALIHHSDIEIRESDTEGDCLRRAKRHTTAETFTYFKSLTRAWQSTVYAHKTPPTAQVSQLIDGFNAAFSSIELSQVEEEAQHE